MKKTSQLFRILLTLILTSIMTQVTATTSAWIALLPDAFSSKKAFDEFCKKVYATTGMSAEWVNNFFQSVLHNKHTELVAELTGIPVAQIAELRDLAIKNQIFDLSKSEPVGMTTQQMIHTASSIARYVNLVTEGKYAEQLISQATVIAKNAKVPVSKVVLLSEKLNRYNTSPVFSSKLVAVSQN